jgi:hypothetical protein
VEETNAHHPPHEPVRYRVAGEIEKDPGQNHSDKSDPSRMGGPGDGQGKACSQYPAGLQAVAGSDRESHKDTPLCVRDRVHGSLKVDLQLERSVYRITRTVEWPFD